MIAVRVMRALLALLLVTLLAVMVASRSGGARAHGGGRTLDQREAAEAKRSFVEENSRSVASLLRPDGGSVRGETLLFYNVHEFRPLNSSEDSTKKVAALASALKSAESVDYVILVETCGDDRAFEVLKASGCRYWLSVANGGGWLVVASPHPFSAAETVSTMEPGQRDCVMFSTAAGRTVAAVHLEIGERLRPDSSAPSPTDNEAARARNSATRIAQLDRLLARTPDYLIGDFNFVLGDPEAEFLRRRGYAPINGDSPRSTPFNRVDHCFARTELVSGLPPGTNALLPVNYSDHLPMLQRIA
jgi:hypothetical protein